MNGKMGSTWVKVARISQGRLHIRGVGRTLMWLGRHFEGLRSVRAEQNDGRILYLNLAECMCLPYLFFGRHPWEAGETSFFKSVLRPGDTAIDIGANVGWFTTLFAELVGPNGRVIAFEPNDAAFRMLAKSAQQYKNTSVFGLAVADKSGEAELHVPEKADGSWASLGEIDPTVGTTLAKPCSVTTLDGFIAANFVEGVKVIKCDAEGFEREVLWGARELLNSSKPPLWVLETSPITKFGRYRPEDVYDILLNARGGYSLYRIESTSGALSPIPHPVSDLFNMAAVPEWLMERVSRIEPRPQIPGVSPR